jgi:hypothetical protein
MFSPYNRNVFETNLPQYLQGSIPGKGFYSSKLHTSSEAHPASCTIFSQAEARPVRGSDHSSSAEIKNE